MEKNKDSKKGEQFGISARICLSAALAGVLVFGIGGWAAQAKLSGAIVAPGQVIVSQQLKMIQHRDGGIVSEILVQNGDAVRKGDVLLRLDETQTRVELAIVRTQLQQLIAMGTRLEAERDGAETLDFSGRGVPAALVASETKLFEENQRMLSNQREQLRLQVRQLKEQVRGFRAQGESNDQERSIVAQEVAKMERLLKNGLVPVSQQRDMLRQMARIDGTRGELAARIAEAESQISETQMKLLSIDQNIRKEAQSEIVGIESKVAELREREIAASDRLSRMEVRAPADGLVYDLQIHTIGGIIGAGATVMSIAPQSEEMNVEIRVAPVDIDRIAPGQPARMRFTAFNQRTTPEVHGTVEVVAAATSTDRNTGQPFYLATLSLDDVEMLGERDLMPGMPVEVYVQTDERSALSYLTKPFTDQMMRAFREE
ncbi:HlyD family type I secretion periplasmic adaptor subunit [Rhizobium sp. BK251]|uniref:HlyD family type I secretion periplasmic adaptor subunit n=1 Tax=Rhizobium sp. BK251 TaxID=2512125 RepID=UPI00104F3E68|nr:HlyD family type I secretion periplasmic adaptor subunit [Rhizobium sp. BK251]TCL68197.1 HlyD family type I secretion membrane fusion protein [Rhizobium sp. BK251]